MRKEIGIEAVARTVPISHLADQHQVSRKFVYQQGDKAHQALDESFTPSKGADGVLFHLPVTKNWLYQLILGLVLICHWRVPKTVGKPGNSFVPCQSVRLSGLENGDHSP
ncbi:MAG: hypothetical protein AAFV90_28040 [Cyanobacteria bacterium J06634_5]